MNNLAKKMKRKLQNWGGFASYIQYLAKALYLEYLKNLQNTIVNNLVIV